MITIIVAVVLLAVGYTANTQGVELVSLILAVALALLSVRGLLAGVRVERDAIAIRGMLSTHRVPWSELEGFSFGPLGMFPAVGIARLRDGRELAMSAIATGRVDSPRARLVAETLIAELNRQLEQHR